MTRFHSSLVFFFFFPSPSFSFLCFSFLSYLCSLFSLRFMRLPSFLPLSFILYTFQPSFLFSPFFLKIVIHSFFIYSISLCCFRLLPLSVLSFFLPFYFFPFLYIFNPSFIFPLWPFLPFSPLPFYPFLLFSLFFPSFFLHIFPVFFYIQSFLCFL